MFTHTWACSVFFPHRQHTCSNNSAKSPQREREISVRSQRFSKLVHATPSGSPGQRQNGNSVKFSQHERRTPSSQLIRTYTRTQTNTRTGTPQGVHITRQRRLQTSLSKLFAERNPLCRLRPRNHRKVLVKGCSHCDLWSCAFLMPCKRGPCYVLPLLKKQCTVLLPAATSSPTPSTTYARAHPLLVVFAGARLLCTH